MKAPLTQPQAKALDIVAKYPGMNPARFAERMWPNSPGHQRSHKCGAYGSSKGGMMAMAAGGYLSRLERKGWLRGVYKTTYREWFITPEGRKALKAYRAWVFEQAKKTKKPKWGGA